jgi:cell division protein FtsW
MPRRAVCDRWLFGTTALLVVFGLFMVGSASTYQALESAGSPSAFLWRHAFHAVLGSIALLAGLAFPYHRLADPRWIGLMLAGCIAALVAVLGAPAAGGAQRWIQLGPLNVQPSELAKIALVVFTAYLLSRREERVNDLWTVPVPCLTVTGSLAFLVVLEPDLGSAAMLVVVACLMLFVAGLNWRYLLVLAGGAACALVVGILAKPYRLERVRAFFDRDADPLRGSFQLHQSLIAVGSGGLTGVGLGQGQQKAFYLPAAHTDFIFSVVGEEAGLVGCVTLVAAFLLLFWRGIRSALRAPDRFGFFLALGLTLLLVLQAMVNMAVCVGLLPTKGLPLPFISYGGSSLLASMLAMGILLNVSQHSN